MSSINTSDICQSVILARLNNTYSEASRNGHLVVYVLLMILSPICVLLFLIEKHRYERTRVRPSIMVITMWLALLGVLNTVNLAGVLGAEYPCLLGTILLILIIPFGASSIISKLLLLFFLSKFNREALNYNRAMNPRQSTDDFVPPTTGFINVIRVAGSSLLFGKEGHDTSSNIMALRFIVSRWGTLSIMFVLLFPFLIISIALGASK
jgi:hypothetical protein